jgi:hypothetical protein
MGKGVSGPKYSDCVTIDRPTLTLSIIGSECLRNPRECRIRTKNLNRIFVLAGLGSRISVAPVAPISEMLVSSVPILCFAGIPASVQGRLANQVRVGCVLCS